ncbi:G-protein associated signal transduction protein [Cryptosporidium ryanae]|uniref:G-protein associated signal transduction protein n=1 Tax=Cryptosporidium ryanae TaxID=515981 RepID=UPI00351A6A36|nr:G-protein associated signal transduction protein [Cryptosporidium ryanae]
MKFSKKLQHYVNQKYSQHYLSYRELKKAIRLITGSDTSSYTINEVTNNFGNTKALSGSVYRPAESRFMDLLNHELDKINSFSRIMFNEIKDSLINVQEYLNQLSIGSLDEKYKLSGANISDNVETIFSETITVELFEDIISPVTEQLDRKSEDIVFLESYQRLNYTGFMKITKKYDKMNKSSSSSWYLARLAREQFMNMNFDMLLECLSYCYEKIEELKKSVNGRINVANKEKCGPNSPSFEFHSKHLISPDDIMKVKVLLLKIVPLFSIGLLNANYLSTFYGKGFITITEVEKEKSDIKTLPPLTSSSTTKSNIQPALTSNINDNGGFSSSSHFPISFSLPYSSSPNSSLNSSQKYSSLANQMSSFITLQTTTVSYLYFDNEEYSEYHRIRNIRTKFSSSTGSSTCSLENINTCEDGNLLLKKHISAYSNTDEKLVPKKYQDHTFRLRWYGDNDGNPEQWINLDWIHPTEPCCSMVEWFDPKVISIEESGQNTLDSNVEIGSNGIKSLFKTDNTESKTMLIQQKDIYHILKTYGNLKKKSKNPAVSNKFDIKSFLNNSFDRKLTRDQIILVNCFIYFIKHRKLGPFIHLWFNRTSFMNVERGIYIHVDNNWKIMPEIDENTLIDENGIHSDHPDNLNECTKDDTLYNSDCEIGVSNSSPTMRPSIIYNTCIVCSQTEAMVSEGIKTIPHAVMSVSIINPKNSRNSKVEGGGSGSSSSSSISDKIVLSSDPREMLKEIFGLVSVSEVIGFSNIETCTALLFSHKLKEVPHWFKYIILEYEDHGPDNNNCLTKDSNSDSQSLSSISCNKLLTKSASLSEDYQNKLNRKIDKSKHFSSNSVNLSKNASGTSKIDVLHTGNNSRIVHDQEATAQREANLLIGGEFQNGSILSSLESNITQKGNTDTQINNNTNNNIFIGKKETPLHSLSISLLDGEQINRENINIDRNCNSYMGIVVNYVRNSRIFRLFRRGENRIFSDNSDFIRCFRGESDGAMIKKKVDVTSSTVRVEPKTFFANERTLLQWMNMSVLLSTISISLLSFGTQVGQICGLIMAPVGIFFIGYSYYIYIKRNKALENKESISYNDKFGPTLLVLCLIVSLSSVLLLNIIVGTNKHKSFINMREGNGGYVDYDSNHRDNGIYGDNGFKPRYLNNINHSHNQNYGESSYT